MCVAMYLEHPQAFLFNPFVCISVPKIREFYRYTHLHTEIVFLCHTLETTEETGIENMKT